MRGIAEVFANSTGVVRSVRSAFRRRRRFVLHVEQVLGTSLELSLVAERQECAQRAERAVFDEIDRLSEILSGYVATSELRRWQERVDCDAVVSTELVEVLELAESCRVRTNGAFNAGVKAIVDALAECGDPGAAVSKIQSPMWRIDRDRGVARRLLDVPISLDAIAKGFIVTRAASAASNVPGVTDVLLNIGGDIQLVGAGERWIGIADPRNPAENVAPLTRVRISNEAVATSGSYRRGFVAAGVRHSHIIDPRTGRPPTDVISASVIAPDCATADALSTAFSVLSPAESVALADTVDGAACLIVARDGTITTNSLWTHHESVSL
ncbi:MAG TPA: FAD:protein FMN transferase [Gemmatimonadaceae bacterium]|jgi:thiamine biosynthesis lipoprotein ApbE|nr:FAD:protein FMN transferase [Gemmatimonadaceae bacterium]